MSLGNFLAFTRILQHFMDELESWTTKPLTSLAFVECESCICLTKKSWESTNSDVHIYWYDISINQGSEKSRTSVMGEPRHLIHQEIQMHLRPLVLLLKWGELFFVEGGFFWIERNLFFAEGGFFTWIDVTKIFWGGDFFKKNEGSIFCVARGDLCWFTEGWFFPTTLTCSPSTKTRPLEQPQRLEVTQRLPVLQLPPAIINHQGSKLYPGVVLPRLKSHCSHCGSLFQHGGWI